MACRQSWTARSRSLSFKRSRWALIMRVSPSATAAQTERMGMMSGIWLPSITVPCSWEGQAMTLSCTTVMLAPICRRTSQIALSPCSDCGERPATSSFFWPITPAAIQKAALLQSPWAVSSPGVRYCCPPEMDQPFSIASMRIPKRASTSSVISTYPLDCSGEESRMRLSPCRSGRANSRPVMYCELMSPAKTKSPL